jgi:hypothetical protein
MKNLSIVAVFVLILLAIIFFPFAVVWALNTLFGLTIGYTFWTWLAVVVLSSVISPTKIKTK